MYGQDSQKIFSSNKIWDLTSFFYDISLFWLPLLTGQVLELLRISYASLWDSGLSMILVWGLIVERGRLRGERD